ncbi:MAG TPA: acyl-CoA dehydrogenase family protein [Actinomycetota bacterium]|nr:acyl-CoA dehydrogenase family protein [Actinomycetota bacterium]
MNVQDGPAEAEFRAGVRAWLAENLPPGWGTPEWRWPEDRVGFLKDWSRRLYDGGYAGLAWPEAYGGRGAPLPLQAIAYEEFARADAPDHVGLIGIGMAGPTIISAGTDEQKARYLRKILTGEEVWCQGFSEPGAGSDLASLQTRAVPDGDGFRITGQKVWSSFAHIADRCILLARTDPAAPKHDGITYFLVDMHADGVEARPLRHMTGDAEFNEIFLDDVYVPREDVVGEVNRGWQVAITTLLHERGSTAFFLLGRLDVRFRRLLQTVRSLRTDGRVAADDPLVREAVARAYADLQALRFTSWRALSDMVRSGMPGPEGSIIKLQWSEANQRLTRLGLDLLGPDAALWPGGHDSWQWQQLRSHGNTIEAGTSEVLRSIVAERVLGLPRSR